MLQPQLEDNVNGGMGSSRYSKFLAHPFISELIPVTSLFHSMVSQQFDNLCCLTLHKCCFVTVVSLKQPSPIFNITSPTDRLTYLAMSVFPVPGGPNRRIPRGGYKLTKIFTVLLYMKGLISKGTTWVSERKISNKYHKSHIPLLSDHDADILSAGPSRSKQRMYNDIFS